MLLMSFSFVYPLTTTLSFTYTPIKVSAIILLFLLLFSVLLYNRMITKITVITVISGGIIISIYAFFTGIISGFLKPFIWLSNYINEIDPLNESYALIFTILLSLVFSLIVYIFTVKKFNFYIISLTGISIYCSQWILNYFVEGKAYIAFYTFIISIVIYYLLHIYNKKSVQESNDFATVSSFIIFTVPIALLVLFLTIFIPVSSKPIEWPWLDQKITKFMTYSENLHGGKLESANYFSISSTGFGNSSGKLGDNVTLNKELVLKVKAPKVMYLKGRSSDQYTGSSWVNSNLSFSELNNPSNKMNFDTFELENGLHILNATYNNQKLFGQYSPIRSYQIDSENSSDTVYVIETDELIGNVKNVPAGNVKDIFQNVSKSTINVNYVDIRTSSLFAPLKSSNFKFLKLDESNVFADAEGVLVSRKPLGKGFSYSFDTYNINYGNKDFEKFMKVSKKNLYNDYLEYCLDEIINYFNDYVLNDLAYDGGHIWTGSEQEIKTLILACKDTESMKNQLTDYLTDHVMPTTNAATNRDATFSSFINILYSRRPFGNNQNLLEWVVSLKSLVDNSDSIYTKYLNVPDTVPSRVKDLAVSITKDKANDYDKVKAIEQYLSSNYNYTLSPGKVPDGRDFTDYFLFDHKEGYCTYFATAMAILTRSIGMPSRFIEGYVLPPFTKGYFYEVTNMQAHAWVEVYFEGIGWIQFEPTSYYRSNLYPSLAPKQNGYHPVPVPSGKTGNAVNLPEDQIEENTEENNTMLIRIVLSFIAAIILIALVVLSNIFRRRRLLSKISRLPQREGVIELYNYFMKYLSYISADIRSGETPLDHAKRLDSYGKFHPDKMLEIAKIFIKARYSQDEITSSEFKRVLSFYKPLRKAAREYLGKVRYTLFMYILFKL